ncbi:MAG: sulfatase [Synoicihabitans sp.]
MAPDTLQRLHNPALATGEISRIKSSIMEIPFHPSSARRLIGWKAIIACLLLATTLQGADSRPHIVFILADDLTYHDIGPYGGPNVHTPHLDKLAEEGMRFNRCYQATAMCSPTRHNLYTGLYPVRSGAYPQATWVYPEVKSVAHYLRPLGYRVGLIGKRHVLPTTAFPFDYLAEENQPDLALVESYLREDPATPTALFLCYREPHTPWDMGDPSQYDPADFELPPNFVDTPRTRELLALYYAEITWLDKQVGATMAMLERLGIADNTLLVFAGEQGSAFPFAKWTQYDAGLRSAFIARWPNVIPAGATTEAMIEYVDMVPTFIDLAGGEPRQDLDGRSFADVLRGETDHHKHHTFGIQTTRGITSGPEHYGVRSIRGERYKYILNLTPEAAFSNNITKTDRKWFSFWKTWVEAGESDSFARSVTNRFVHRPGEELYDLTTDPYELHNLAEDPRLEAIKTDLRARLLAWMQDQGDTGQEAEMAANFRNLKTPEGVAAYPYDDIPGRRLSGGE